MLIDWFTLTAQALNFLILVWLMKRYLYRPILDAIATREKLIAGELADAAAKKAEAQKEREGFEHKNQEFDRRHAALMSKAAAEAKAEGERLLVAARQAADALLSQRAETLIQEAQALHKTLTGRAQQEVFAIARQALADLAGARLEERMGAVFIGRLGALDGKAKAELSGALKTAADPALVRSTCHLPAAQRAAIQKVLAEMSDGRTQVRFETSPDLVCGIELVTHGRKFAWSIADYLASLAKGVEELLQKEEAQPAAGAKPEATSAGKMATKPRPKRQPKPKPDQAMAESAASSP
jgi:F-type H+-transporting ATPase subunit b